MKLNYHVHDRYSSDARGTAEEVVRRAAELGFEEICLTNHVEVLTPEGEWEIDFVEARERFERLAREIAAVRSAFPHLRILLGAELEYRPEWIESLERLTASIEFDFLLGSVHVVDGHNISGGAAAVEYFKGKDLSEAYGRYFAVLEEMVKWGGFDVVAHFDLIKRFGAKVYGPYAAEDFASQIEAILQRMARRGIGLEVNTSGVVQPPGEPYPGAPILSMAKKAGINTITIGTDSHVPERLDQGWEAGCRLLLEAGWTHLATFDRRILRMVPIRATAS